MTEQDQLSERYRAYIDCINANTMKENLPKYCHDVVVHNERKLTLEQYRLLIQESKDAIPDLQFHIDTLMIDTAAQKLAVRLLFTGTPVQPVVGCMPNGKKVHFSEHVFYQLHDGKISTVWSIVDWELVRTQLAA